MKVLHPKGRSLGKWIIAMTAFVAVMTFAIGDVYGITTPGKPGTGGSEERHPNPSVNEAVSTETQAPSPEPVAVPEPGTMVLMGLGLGAAAIYRKTKKN